MGEEQQHLIAYLILQYQILVLYGVVVNMLYHGIMDHGAENATFWILDLPLTTGRARIMVRHG
jgi:hypothetical protein